LFARFDLQRKRGQRMTGDRFPVISMGSASLTVALRASGRAACRLFRYALLVSSLALVIGGSLEKEMQSVAAGLGGQIEVLGVATIGEIDRVFASLAQKRTEALFVGPGGAFLTDRRVQLATLATRYAIPPTVIVTSSKPAG
jgi:hypothetical protein